MIDIINKRIIIVKHSYFETSGIPERELVKFLVGKTGDIIYIYHPFSDAESVPLNSVMISFDKDGKENIKKKSPDLTGNSLFFYIKDFFYTVLWILKSGKKHDLFIGVDNLNALSGLFLRMLGFVDKVIYYVMDFTPARFSNRSLNWIYQQINKICCYHSDYIWNVSETMIDGRHNIGIRKDLSAKQITVPLGNAYDEMPRKNWENISPHTLVYFGSMREEHGPGLIIEALPYLIARFKDTKVIFAGGGILLDSLKHRAVELGVSDNITFTGFVDKVEDAYEIISSSGLALATYPPSEDTYKQYCDPGKVKIYLACGAPVIITDVPAIAGEIAAKKAGSIVEYTKESLAETIEKIFDNENYHRELRDNAVSLGSEYSWEKIWNNTFKSM